jgi:ribonuclease HII
MNESKELLEATIKGLEEKVNQLNNDLATKKKELENVNKPKLNQSTMDIIYDCVTEGIEEYDFSDVDGYEFEPEFDYDSKVVIGSIDLTHKEYIKEPIIKLIESRFNIIDDTEDENSAQ